MTKGLEERGYCFRRLSESLGYEPGTGRYDALRRTLSVFCPEGAMWGDVFVADTGRAVPYTELRKPDMKPHEIGVLNLLVSMGLLKLAPALPETPVIATLDSTLLQILSGRVAMPAAVPSSNVKRRTLDREMSTN